MVLQKDKRNSEMFEHYFYFLLSEKPKRTAEYLAHEDNSGNSERKRQKTGISANKQLNTLITEWLDKFLFKWKSLQNVVRSP